MENINKTIDEFIKNNPDKTVMRSCLSKNDGYIKLWYMINDEEFETEIEIKKL
ncbi:MAG: hypothetical protein V8Q75_06385 [Bacilli bacterium]